MQGAARNRCNPAAVCAISALRGDGPAEVAPPGGAFGFRARARRAEAQAKRLPDSDEVGAPSGAPSRFSAALSPVCRHRGCLPAIIAPPSLYANHHDLRLDG